jgi:uncharacterized protein with HEPN domain
MSRPLALVGGRFFIDNQKESTQCHTRLDKAKATFVQDETLKRAYVGSIEVIEEAVKQLPDGLDQKYSALE